MLISTPEDRTSPAFVVISGEYHNECGQRMPETWEYPSRMKPRIVAHRSQAFVERQIGIDLDPLPSMAYERQVEMIAANVFQASKLGVEEWRDGVGTRSGTPRTEIEVTAAPFGVEIHQVLKVYN